VVTIVVILAAVSIVVALVAAGAAWRRTRRSAVSPQPASDLSNAMSIGVATGHAWLAADRAAKARAVTEQARRDRFD
jgi:hypothetical protein